MTLDEIKVMLSKLAVLEMRRSVYLELKAFGKTPDFKNNLQTILLLPEWKTIIVKYGEVVRGEAVDEYEKLMVGERNRGRISTEDTLDGLVRALHLPFADEVSDAQIVDLLDALNQRSHGKYAFDQSPAFQKLTLQRPFAIGMFLGRKDDAR